MSCSTAVISEAVWLCVPVVVRAFAIVILFVCTHIYAVEHLMRRRAVFMFRSAPVVCHHTANYRPGMHTAA